MYYYKHNLIKYVDLDKEYIFMKKCDQNLKDLIKTNIKTCQKLYLIRQSIYQIYLFHKGIYIDELYDNYVDIYNILIDKVYKGKYDKLEDIKTSKKVYLIHRDIKPENLLIK